MALDGIFLRHIKNEIETTAVGARVSQIYQPNRDELVFALRTFNGNKKLLLSARANSPRIHFCKQSPENPSQPPMFCMLLRKRIGGGKLVGVRQLECDRVLFLDFECVNELGDLVKITVVCEIMGMYSNIIIVNSDGIIIDSLKRVDLTMSSCRLVLPNLKYELPDSQNKLNVLENSPQQIATAVINAEPETNLSKALLSTIQGVSPLVCRELEYRVSEDCTNKLNKEQTDKLVEELTAFQNIVKNCTGQPYLVYKEDGRPMDYSFIQIQQYKGFLKVEKENSFSQLLDEFYEKRDIRERMRVKSQDLTKLLTNLRDRTARKISKQQIELKQCANREQLRIYGDLLQANLYKIKKGATFAEVENFYDEQGKTIRINLNPAISPANNAQKFYKNYQKAKNAEHILKEQIKNANVELEYIESVLDIVTRAESEKELMQVREELVEQGYLKRQNKKKKQSVALSPIEFLSSDGFKILVGRNNKQNDMLTLKMASKNDMWLHTKDIHGSHTIIISDGKQIPDNTILEAASISAYHSKAQNSSKVPVDYTQVKYVSKPSGAKPGMVIYVNNKTVYVNPKSEI